MGTFNIPPPIRYVDIPLTHKFEEFYKKTYLLSGKISKRDRFGIYLKIDKISLDIFNLIITASFEIRANKLSSLNAARVKIEVVKRLIRMMSELKIMEPKKYIDIQADLQEISKMVTGWIKYLKN